MGFFFAAMGVSLSLGKGLEENRYAGFWLRLTS